MSVSLRRDEARALARWRPPGDPALNRLLTVVVVGLSRFVNAWTLKEAGGV